MASTTTNYGFDVPTSSDLVKNGATQIALLGQDLDTFLFRPFSKNAVINGGFDIWQRGTTQTYTGAAATGFLADRWGSYTTNSGTATQDTTLIQADSQYALRWTSTTASGGNLFLQSIETANTVPLAGKTVTLTVYVAGSAGKSPSIALGYSTTTDLGPVNAFTGITATSGTTTVTSSGTYQKLSAVYAVPTTAKTLRVSLATGTLNNTEYINFSQCQLEIGSQATPFSRAGGTIQGELAACQRYFQRINVTSEIFGYCYATNSYVFGFTMPVTPRVIPTGITVIDIFNSLVYNQLNSSAVPSAITINSGGTSLNTVSLLATATGTAGNVGRLGLGTASIEITGCEL